MGNKEIVILANSRRHGAHCIAGKDPTTGEWIRPLSIFGKGRSDPDAFSDDDLKRVMGNPSGPKLLDLIKMGVGPACRTNCQPENYAIDGKPWELLSRYSCSRVSALVDTPEYCFLGKNDPFNDRIPVAYVKLHPLSSSLNLIKMNMAKNAIALSHTKKEDGTYKHKMQFTYDDHFYRISVTDSYYEKVYQATEIDDSLVFNDFFMTIGVGADAFKPDYATEPYHFRLIVGIIPSNNIKEYSL